MKREKKKPSARNLSRLFRRKQDKLVEDRERLAGLEPGGSPERPILLEAASQLTLRTQSFTCLACDGPLRYVEDRVLELNGELRRAAMAECKQCGKRREVWFQIVVKLLN